MYNFLTIVLVIFFVTSGRTEKNCQEDVSIEAFKKMIPNLGEENGTILILHGEEEIGPNRAYFVAMGALKAGADQVYILSPNVKSAAMLQSFSPDYTVYPYFSREDLPMIENAISTADVVVLGPGPTSVDGFVAKDVVGLCKKMRKPLIVNSGAMFDVAMNIYSLKADYPAPGAILLPDKMESNQFEGFGLWGDHVDVLVRDYQDYFYSKGEARWNITEENIQKHKGQQGDILAGFLSSFYSWALKSKSCSPQYIREIASYAASRLIRAAREQAYTVYGRSMTPTDILGSAHIAFRNLYDNTS